MTVKTFINRDETGLLTEPESQNTLKFKREKCIVGKLSEEYITIHTKMTRHGKIETK